MWFDDIETYIVAVFLLAVAAVAIGGGAIGFTIARLL